MSFELATIFSYLEEQDRSAVFSTCRFWRRNYLMVCPERSYAQAMAAKNVPLACALFAYFGDRFRSCDLFLYQTCSLGLVDHFAHFFARRPNSERLSWALEYVLARKILQDFSVKMAQIIDPLCTVDWHNVISISSCFDCFDAPDGNLEFMQWMSATKRIQWNEMLCSRVKNVALTRWLVENNYFFWSSSSIANMIAANDIATLELFCLPTGNRNDENLLSALIIAYRLRGESDLLVQRLTALIVERGLCADFANRILRANGVQRFAVVSMLLSVGRVAQFPFLPYIGSRSDETSLFDAVHEKEVKFILMWLDANPTHPSLTHFFLEMLRQHDLPEVVQHMLQMPSFDHDKITMRLESVHPNKKNTTDNWKFKSNTRILRILLSDSRITNSRSVWPSQIMRSALLSGKCNIAHEILQCTSIDLFNTCLFTESWINNRS